MPEIHAIDIDGTGSPTTVGGVVVRYTARFSPLETFLVQHGLVFREEVEVLDDRDHDAFVTQTVHFLGRDEIRESDRVLAIRRELTNLVVSGQGRYRARVILRPLNLPVRDVEVSSDTSSGIQGDR